ncbi:MAG: trehalase family glycosidase [Chloroflexota bacterium]
MTATGDDRDLVTAARNVLAGNDLGHSTKPAPGLYPHQWNWDSCFIAIGIAHYDTARAAEELRSLLRGQWRNGMVPQIVFNPQGTGYFPGPDVWQCTRSDEAPSAVETSGITQPPVLATAALRVSENFANREDGVAFLRDVYPSILKYHEFLYTERDLDGGGLISVVHPWESGLDNSPPYLDAGSRVRLRYTPHYERLDTLHVAAKNRPTNKDYDLFIYLLEQMRDVKWDQRRYMEIAPLAVEDVLFNSILCRANMDLGSIAETLGEDRHGIDAWLHQTRQAINDKLWDGDAATYYSYDRIAGRLLKVDTIAGMHALWGRVAPADRAEQMIDSWLTSDRFWPDDGYPIPTTSMDSAAFNPENYWLGPVWVNTNWMIADGLREYGFGDRATHLEAQTVELIRRSGFREYYHPRTGEGFGTDSFSWSAALALDMVSQAAPLRTP